MSARLNMVISNEIFEAFEKGRTTLSLSRPKYIEYLLNTGKDIRPRGLKHKELIACISEMNLLLRSLIISEKVDEKDALLLFEKINEIEERIKNI